MRGRNLLELRARLGERNVDDRFPALCSGKQKLQAGRRLPGARSSLHEVEARPGKPAPEDEIEALDASRNKLLLALHVIPRPWKLK
jgi:hypothetical protein